jgi:myo-inositol-1-phosphate synthase
MEKVDVKEARGKLGILVVGVGGAVASTFIAGTLSVRKGFGKPIGSITQLATIRLGKRNENRFPKIKDVVPLAALDDLVFGGWDIFEENVYEAAIHAEVLKKEDLEVVKDELSSIRPMPAVFDQHFVKRLHGTHVKPEASRRELAEQLREDIRSFKAANGCERVVVMWAASTEIYIPQSSEHESLAAFEQAFDENRMR